MVGYVVEDYLEHKLVVVVDVVAVIVERDNHWVYLDYYCCSFHCFEMPYRNTASR